MIATLTYTNATIYFPEDVDIETLKVNTKLYRDKLSFLLGDLLVDAKISYNIPSEWSGKNIVKRDIIKPVKELLSNDILPCLEEINEIRSLARKGEHETKLFYERLTKFKDYDYLNEFKVYDYIRAGKENPRFFEFVFNLKTEPIYKLPKILESYIAKQNGTQTLIDFLDFISLTEPVNKDTEGKLPYVSGSSLKEALKREINIYEKFKFLTSLEIEIE